MFLPVCRATKKDEMREDSGKTESGRAESPASLANERDHAIAGVKKAIRAAELSDDLNADLKEALVQSLKRGLAELEQLDPDAPIDSGVLSALARHILSMSQGRSYTVDVPRSFVMNMAGDIMSLVWRRVTGNGSGPDGWRKR